MTSKERMLCALHLGKPDRLPGTVHQWQGYHLKYYMNNMDVLDAFEACGLDASVQYFEAMGQFWLPGRPVSNRLSESWVDDVAVENDDIHKMVARHTIRTPEGTLTYKTEGNEKTTWITEDLIKSVEDFRLIRHHPVPKLDKENIAKEYSRIGDRGILRGFVWGDQAGCWQQACTMYGTENMIYAAYDYPDAVHEFLDILLQKKLQFIYESLKGAKFDLIETGGGASSSTVISPAMFSEFCLPYDRKIHDALHDVGHISTYHTCGGMAGILELIKETHTDASETLAPKSVGGNIEGPEVFEAFRGKVCMIGGIDQYNVLTDLRPEDLKKEIKRLFGIYGEDGGYIMSCADHFFDVPVENLKAYGEALRECVY